MGNSDLFDNSASCHPCHQQVEMEETLEKKLNIEEPKLPIKMEIDYEPNLDISPLMKEKLDLVEEFYVSCVPMIWILLNIKSANLCPICNLSS